MKQPLKEALKRIGGDRLLKESTWANRKFGEPLPTMADYKKAHKEGKINEVGAAPQHKKYINNIWKAEENMHKHIQEYKYFLEDQDLAKEAQEFGSKYITMIGKFTHYLKTKWVKMVRKMI